MMKSLNWVVGMGWLSGICGWALLSDTFGGKYAKVRMGVAALLCVIFAADMGWVTSESHYALLRVPVKSTKSDISAAYRALSKIYHPDRAAPGQNTEELFRSIKMANDVLTHTTLRSVYDRFGDFHENGEFDDKTTIMSIAMTCVAQLLLFCSGYLFTFSKDLTTARMVTQFYALIGVCLELQFRFIEDDFLFQNVGWFNIYSPWEQITIIRSMFPCVLMLSMIISKSQFIDEHSETMQVLRGILSSQRVVIDRAHEVVRATAFVKASCTPGTAALQRTMAEAKKSGLKAPKGVVRGAPVLRSQDNERTEELDIGSDEEDLDFKSFAEILSAPQRSQFQKVMSNHYRVYEQEKGENVTVPGVLGMSWGAIGVWAILILLYIYFHVWKDTPETLEIPNAPVPNPNVTTRTVTVTVDE